MDHDPPYDETLNRMKAAEVRTWADGVFEQLAEVTDPEHDEFVFLAGERYRSYLVGRLRRYQVPMQGLSIGNQLQFLKRSLARGI